MGGGEAPGQVWRQTIQIFYAGLKNHYLGSGEYIRAELGPSTPRRISFYVKVAFSILSVSPNIHSINKEVEIPGLREWRSPCG